ncbi:zinc transporter 1 [Galendromus occidentalis]|uniref:Zinc transporter 1 n=1 Tax=Galendromus occidentalis TaxID=34638 RepID=A0AAJ6VZX3_9ACAR|nr:zinc transporter 1 [Galendromus occidentalis]
MECIKCTRATVLASIVFVFFVAQMIACYISQSLTLQMNTYHTLFNFMSLALIVYSQKTASSKTLRNTFGSARTEVVGTLCAVLFLYALCFSITTHSVQTLFHKEHEDVAPKYPLVILIFGALCLSLNLFCLVLIGGHDRGKHPGSHIVVRGNKLQVNFVERGSTQGIDVHKRMRYLSENGEEAPQIPDRKQIPIIKDILKCIRTTSSCFTVIVCSLVIIFAEDENYVKCADADLALITVAVIVVTFYPDLRNSALILLQSVPEDVKLDQLQQRMLIKFPELINLHDLHIWALNENHCIATIHVTLKLCHQEHFEKLSYRIEDFLYNNGIDSVTIQPEFCEVEPTGPVKCATKCDACTQQTCCIGERLDQNSVVFAQRRRQGSKESFIISPSTSQQAEERQSAPLTSEGTE